ncbi:MAG: nucleoside triphosphate pyrophosphatase [Salibaculum sp.]|jgi:septum formation protein|uniref:Maf family protein n=1 Tax=Salibaculum sp. TaxID=2855480 RepID=UPI00287069C5|nr:nucleoside triphosphate pyrophosphatase [Salibaculum sp.]MDR9427893.1 nucleoside triphosphate pyrophosphatase [Salibaculum sp.]MDR9482197.1 nucleoside triphosphate pyrophosphatase [Salibaculum sp.]
MTEDLILASASQIRSRLLGAAAVPHESIPARIDEDSLRASMIQEDAKARDIADALAEMKARKVSQKYPEALVLGCDQVLAHDNALLSKPETPQEARTQLAALRGTTHQLLSAAVLYQDAEPLWRHIGVARLTMRSFSDAYLDDYITRNWDSIRWSVGGYKIEEEGIRLFSNIAGDHFTVQGLPLIELLSYLTLRGTLPT